MTREYKTVAMPQFLNARPKRGRSRADAIADALSDAINREAVDGWSYLRAEQFRTHERRNIFSRAEEVGYSVLVFVRDAPAERAAGVSAAVAEPTLVEPPAPRRRAPDPAVAEPERAAPRPSRRPAERFSEPEIDLDQNGRALRGGRRDAVRGGDGAGVGGDEPSFAGRPRRSARSALDDATDDAARAMRRPPSRAAADDEGLFDDRPVAGRRLRGGVDDGAADRNTPRRRR